MSNFSLNLSKELREKEVSQLTLAKHLHVTQQAISNWAKGVTEPNIDTLIKIGDFFLCSVDYLLGRESEDGIITIRDDNSHTLLSEELNEVYIKLNSFYKGMLVGYARTLLKEQQERA